MVCITSSGASLRRAASMRSCFSAGYSTPDRYFCTLAGELPPKPRVMVDLRDYSPPSDSLPLLIRSRTRSPPFWPASRTLMSPLPLALEGVWLLRSLFAMVLSPGCQGSPSGGQGMGCNPYASALGRHTTPLDGPEAGGRRVICACPWKELPAPRARVDRLPAQSPSLCLPLLIRSRTRWPPLVPSSE